MKQQDSVPGRVRRGLVALSCAIAVLAASGAVDATGTGGPHAVSMAEVITSSSAATSPSSIDGLHPGDIADAYQLSGGVTGRTVAVVIPYDTPTLESDLAVYRSTFGLPACTTANGCFRKVDQTGGTSYPASNSSDALSWSLEASLDVDAVSAACPSCRITVVEATSSGISSLGTAENEAVSLGAAAVTNSWGLRENIDATYYAARYFDHPGVPLLAATGDNAYPQAYMPATFPDVIAVGGTTLRRAGVSAAAIARSATDGIDVANGAATPATAVDEHIVAYNIASANLASATRRAATLAAALSAMRRTAATATKRCSAARTAVKKAAAAVGKDRTVLKKGHSAKAKRALAAAVKKLARARASRTTAQKRSVRASRSVRTTTARITATSRSVTSLTAQVKAAWAIVLADRIFASTTPTVPVGPAPGAPIAPVAPVSTTTSSDPGTTTTAAGPTTGSENAPVSADPVASAPLIPAPVSSAPIAPEPARTTAPDPAETAKPEPLRTAALDPVGTTAPVSPPSSNPTPTSAPSPTSSPVPVQTTAAPIPVMTLTPTPDPDPTPISTPSPQPTTTLTPSPAPTSTTVATPAPTVTGIPAPVPDPQAGRAWHETAWSGAGSGCSAYVTKPAHQTDSACPSTRTVSDIAAVADPATGLAVYDTSGTAAAGWTTDGWLVAGGTSLATPLIAGMIVRSGDAADYDDGGPLYADPSAFWDITSGSNGSCAGTAVCTAGVGYDGPTGLGTPKSLSSF